MRAATTRSLTSDLFLVVLAVLPLLYVAGVGRGDDPDDCPYTKAIDVPCPKGESSAKCDTYPLSSPPKTADCAFKYYRVTYIGKFDTGSSTKRTEGYPEMEEGMTPPVAKTAECSRVYECVIDLSVTSMNCVQGKQVGETKTAPIYATRDCKWDVIDP